MNSSLDDTIEHSIGFKKGAYAGKKIGPSHLMTKTVDMNSLPEFSDTYGNSPLANKGVVPLR